ncbi:Heparinase II/III-like protein [Fodinibius roseus]|uniref:Heparinase II/III-like protein n=1 Tax=Fodinibius roseus TaxID=1194090 RepID=A0A1M5GRV1_9BACT|nr:heparinase II/III family protein [Fodinibius roseus]SHG06469.1 Heparinase II/III-like protein [Fodinibius roseus]
MKLRTASGFSLPLTVLFILCLWAGSCNDGSAQPHAVDEAYRLENPMTQEYLQANLNPATPRLILNEDRESLLREKLQSNPVVGNMYQALKLNAGQIRSQPLLEREMVGRRLLGTSREMLYRMNVLGMVYRMEEDPAVLERINEELQSVISFSDWNPSHFLDVAEMSLAVALAIDWVGDDLPASTVAQAKTALIEKGIKPSYNEEVTGWWITGDNNWNQVCHGGMIAAAIVVAGEAPELAARTISRALDGMPHALKEYGPDGVYPEGPTYWGYGTGFSVLTASMLESAFGTDFGLSGVPGFMESADFLLLSTAPSGMYFNFADSGDRRSANGNLTLAWFAAQTGNEIYFERERFLRDPREMGELTRHAGAGLVWLAQFNGGNEKELPRAWKGEGANPIVIFRGGVDDPREYFFGGKGGRGTVNHGNMDAGSFVFELDGVRWVVDPGNQSYHALEKTGFNLWGSCQECERWTLLTKNNYGHSTLTVNEALHNVDGFASLAGFDEGATPRASFEMSKVFGGQLEEARRTFVKENNRSLLIEDQLTLADSTELVTWQLMTTAEVVPTGRGAILRQEDKELNLEILSPEGLKVSVVSLDPPPLELDRQIDNLKRVEIRIPAWYFDGPEGEIRVRLWGASQ